MKMRKNKNRGFQKLRVWQDAIEFYKYTCNIFRNFPYELKLIESIEHKRDQGDWIDRLTVKEINETYGIE